MNIVRHALLFSLLKLSSAANLGYQNCLLGTGQQTPLLLQNGIRCVQVQPEIQNSWADAMDLCNSRGGYLLHIYTSMETRLLNSWLIKKALPGDCYIGQKQMGPLNGNYTGFRIRWFVSNSEDIGFDQYYQYSATDWDWNNGMNKELDRTHGGAWSTGELALYGNMYFTNAIGTKYALCQFLKAKPSVNFFIHHGKRSLAPVYKIVNKKKTCWIECYCDPWVSWIQ